LRADDDNGPQGRERGRNADRAQSLARVSRGPEGPAPSRMSPNFNYL
jgi:hypothetical protein